MMRQKRLSRAEREHLRQFEGEGLEVTRLNHGEPLPDGYAPIDGIEVDSHHKYFGRLIARRP